MFYLKIITFFIFLEIFFFLILYWFFPSVFNQYIFYLVDDSTLMLNILSLFVGYTLYYLFYLVIRSFLLYFKFFKDLRQHFLDINNKILENDNLLIRIFFPFSNRIIALVILPIYDRLYKNIFNNVYLDITIWSLLIFIYIFVTFIFIKFYLKIQIQNSGDLKNFLATLFTYLGFQKIALVLIELFFVCLFIFCFYINITK